MKIAVDGDIIDTNDIYKITKINFEYHSKFLDEFTNEVTWLSFYIVLFNKVEIEISKSLYSLVPSNSLESIEFHAKKEALKDFQTKRDIIIAYWSNNQSDIPQINF